MKKYKIEYCDDDELWWVGEANSFETSWIEDFPDLASAQEFKEKQEAKDDR